eukprot:scaffold34033_cov27-Tisochrysis_lutea.AAC.2
MSTRHEQKTASRSASRLVRGLRQPDASGSSITPCPAEYEPPSRGSSRTRYALSASSASLTVGPLTSTSSWRSAYLSPKKRSRAAAPRIAPRRPTGPVGPARASPSAPL